MSFNFSGTPLGGVSSGASNPATTSTAPATSGLFSTAAGASAKPSFSFGANATSTPGAAVTPTSGGLFGSSTASTGGGSFSQKPAGTSLFGPTTAPAATSSFGLGDKTAAPTTTSAAPGTGLFGAAATGTSQASTKPLFGGLGAPAASGLQSTPAKPLFGGLGSTTPAGAPPSNTTKAEGLFSTTASAAQPKKNLVEAGAPGLAAALSKPAADGGGNSFFMATTPSLFTNTSTKPAAPSVGPLGQAAMTTAPATSAPATALSFAATGAQPSVTAAASQPSIFPTAGTTTTHATTTAPATSGLFGSKPTATATAPLAGGLFPTASTTTTSAPASTGLFGSTAATAAAAVAPTGSSLLFGSKPASSAAPATSATTTAAASGTATTNAGTTTTAAPTAPGLFGAPKPVATTAAAAAAKLDGKSAATTGAALTASTIGPASQLPRLKNKTMDEIITRWATDLSKYQKEFKEQASKVAEWDRMLVENGEKIQKLYSSTYEAERVSNEIERQLASVEGQQDELAAWLDRYEADLNELFVKQIGTKEQVAGPDQERERTYKLAEKLTDRLDEMGKDLTKMIREINDMSSGLNKGSKPDDPLSQIVRVLNGHLTQLQWIDTNALALQAKVTAAQKASGDMGASARFGESDAAEGFYRSFRGGYK